MSGTERSLSKYIHAKLKKTETNPRTSYEYIVCGQRLYVDRFEILVLTSAVAKYSNFFHNGTFVSHPPAFYHSMGLYLVHYHSMASV